MSENFSGREIAEKALRKIGVFSTYDTAADPVQLAEALDWLDLVIAHAAGKTRLFFLTPSELSVSLTGDQQEYDLIEELAANAPDRGIQRVTFAALDDGNGNRTPLTLISSTEKDSKLSPADTGTPTEIYVDRQTNPTLFTYPVLASGVTGYSIKLTVQTYGEEFASHRTGNKATGVRTSWQKWLIYELSKCLGDGTIISLPSDDWTRIASIATESWNDLFAYDARESVTPGCVKFRDF